MGRSGTVWRLRRGQRHADRERQPALRGSVRRLERQAGDILAADSRQQGFRTLSDYAAEYGIVRQWLRGDGRVKRSRGAREVFVLWRTSWRYLNLADNAPIGAWFDGEIRVFRQSAIVLEEGRWRDEEGRPSRDDGEPYVRPTIGPPGGAPVIPDEPEELPSGARTADIDIIGHRLRTAWQGVPMADAAAALGMTAEAYRKAVWRARGRLAAAGLKVCPIRPGRPGRKPGQQDVLGERGVA